LELTTLQGKFNRLVNSRQCAMVNPCIITVAITGSLPGKKDNPAVSAGA
jgi:hypothetical protein